MVSPVIVSIGIAAAVMASLPGFDFTPRESVRELEGARFAELLFTDGAWDVGYTPPRAWSYHGEANVLTLQPLDKEQVDAKMVISKASGAPVKLDAAGMKALRAQAQAILPRGGEGVRLVSEAKDAVTINGHETYEATFAYGLFGQSFETCVLFVFMGDRQMTIQVSSLPKDFAEVYGVFHGSLFSFHWMKPKS